MRVAITGSTGLIGQALVASLRADRHEVLRVVRRPAAAGEVVWDPDRGAIDAAALEGLDAAVHLAGAPIAEGRWNEARKREIKDSREKGTRLFAETLTHLDRPPAVLVSGSAIGWYGNRGDEILAETAPPGADFVSEVGRVWEGALEPARTHGIRVVILRTGIVLTARGGALRKMLPPFRLGAGGVLGSGRQWMSWIDLDDHIGVVRHAIGVSTLSGPVNAAAPNPVTNREFTRTLGRVLHRPVIFPMPAFAARLVFGEVADELLLSSTRVSAERLLSSGFAFRYPTLEASLRHALAGV